MKTTVEISDELLVRAKRLAKKRNWSVREVFEESLRDYLDRNAKPGKQFRLCHSVFGGPETRADVPSWPAIRDLIYGLPTGDGTSDRD